MKHVKAEKTNKQTNRRFGEQKQAEKRRLVMKWNQTAGDIFRVNSFSPKTKESKRQKILRRCRHVHLWQTQTDAAHLLTFNYLLIFYYLHWSRMSFIHPSSVHPPICSASFHPLTHQSLLPFPLFCTFHLPLYKCIYPSFPDYSPSITIHPNLPPSVHELPCIFLPPSSFHNSTSTHPTIYQPVFAAKFLQHSSIHYFTPHFHTFSVSFHPLIHSPVHPSIIYHPCILLWWPPTHFLVHPSSYSFFMQLYC